MNGISDNDAILPQQHHNSDGSVVTVWDEVAAILSALIGGGRYGLKIRVPHAVGKFVPPYVYTMLQMLIISLFISTFMICCHTPFHKYNLHIIQINDTYQLMLFSSYIFSHDISIW